jgi:very-short-patch-repair endonuclease
VGGGGCRGEEGAVSKSDLEAKLLLHIRGVGLPEPVREHHFAKSIGRRFRFDFAWPAHMLAVEVEGIGDGRAKNRHTSRAGYAEDCVKYTEAAILGWRVLRFTGDQVDSGYAVGAILRAMGEE